MYSTGCSCLKSRPERTAQQDETNHRMVCHSAAKCAFSSLKETSSVSGIGYQRSIIYALAEPQHSNGAQMRPRRAPASVYTVHTTTILCLGRRCLWYPWKLLPPARMVLLMHDFCWSVLRFSHELLGAICYRFRSNQKSTSRSRSSRKTGLPVNISWPPGPHNLSFASPPEVL